MELFDVVAVENSGSLVHPVDVDTHDQVDRGSSGGLDDLLETLVGGGRRGKVRKTKIMI